MATETLPDSSAGPPPGEFVDRQLATLFEPPDVLKLEGKRTLGPVTVAYETYGILSPAKDNAIFVCHALTGDAHVAGRHSEEDRKPGWWDGFVGPGKALDTDRYFVICANILGGCQGTTGPASINPETGEPFGADFPFITVADIVNVHHELVTHLGISRLLAVIGGSLGGKQVLEWAAQFPNSIASAIVLASAPRLNAQAIAFNKVARRAIITDPCFRDGQYYGHQEKPRFGLALARMIAHITYLSEQAIEEKFGRRLQHSEELTYDLLKETEFQVESYLDYQGKQFVDRFDANSYLLLTRAMDYYDLEATRGPINRSLAETNAGFLVVSYTTDWLYPTSQSKRLVKSLLEARREVTFTEFKSPHGHDSFLIDSELPRLQSLVQPFLHSTYRRVLEMTDDETSNDERATE